MRCNLTRRLAAMVMAVTLFGTVFGLAVPAHADTSYGGGVCVNNLPPGANPCMSGGVTFFQAGGQNVWGYLYGQYGGTIQDIQITVESLSYSYIDSKNCPNTNSCTLSDNFGSQFWGYIQFYVRQNNLECSWTQPFSGPFTSNHSSQSGCP